MRLSIEPVHVVAGGLVVGLIVAIGVTVSVGAPGITSPDYNIGMGSSVNTATPSAEEPVWTQPIEVSASVTSVTVASPQWVESAALATGVPARAVEAYGNATLASMQTDPSCGVGWTTLAAIGAVESGHGTHGHTQLGEDGRPLAAILGPALDGRPGFAAIPATPESAKWTGDPQWDRAVGPMQFLTSTWSRWAADGDGDGIADPNDLDDAALGAAHYLCAAGGDVTSSEGWTKAILAYNHSDAYVAQVLGIANGYAQP